MNKHVKLLDKETCATVLPKQLFRNHFTWMFYEIFYMYATWLSPLLSLATGLSVLMFSQQLGFLLVSVLMVAFVLSMQFPKLWFRYMRQCTAAKRKEDIARNVTLLDPGVALEKWELVAHNLNRMLYDDDSWRTPHFFFNGEQCQSCFRDEVVRPLMQGKVGIEFNEKNTLSEAVESYQSALKNTFNEMQRDSLPDLSQENRVLPKYKHYTKLSFHKRYFVSVSFLPALICGCYNLFFMAPLIKSSYVMMLFCSFCIIYVAVGNYKAYSIIKCAKLDLKSRVIFLATMVRIAPGVETDKWDQIAMHMNQYLQNAAVWKTYDEKFFDGVECLNFFKAEFRPLASGKLKLAYPELQNLVAEVVEVCGLE